MKIETLFLVLCFLVHKPCFSQSVPNEFSVLFYNVENLFDTENNPTTNDDEFTPNGARRWTFNRMNQKLVAISKAIINSSGWTPPVIVGLCEIENRNVLERLITLTPLKSIPYKIIHKESPDHRGIDVALIYNKDYFSPITYKCYPLTSKKDSVLKTREILYVSGCLNKTDTLHIFVNHWPSRYSGILETKANRNRAASILRKNVDILLDKTPLAKIVILGDFNDQPTDESIAEILKTKKMEAEREGNELVNLSSNWLKKGWGTLKYHSQWAVFDQIIVSTSLLEPNNGFKVKPESASPLQFPFLLEKDEKFGGLKPNRSFIGFKYKKGFSDHLPVLFTLSKSDKN